MLLKWLRVINYLIQSHLVCQLLSNLCFLMYGVLPKNLLVVLNTMSFIDNYNEFTWIYLLKKKSDVFQKFCDFCIMLSDSLIRKSLLCKPIGEENIKKLNSFF
jgi:hypothetical protein